ncbi:MAG: hypothetical protein KGD63_04205 [Candidatus Lokiarchaeota archaeon]|nr:hypothetical protein [Candidatus Lokiarchaeota archaeon]
MTEFEIAIYILTIIGLFVSPSVWIADKIYERRIHNKKERDYLIRCRCPECRKQIENKIIDFKADNNGSISISNGTDDNRKLISSSKKRYFVDDKCNHCDYIFTSIRRKYFKSFKNSNNLLIYYDRKDKLMKEYLKNTFKRLRKFEVVV